MFRIFYFNTNFTCNNNCLFCFSYNTYFHKCYTISESDVVEAIHKYSISSKDMVIINGGEPTLHSHLLKLLLEFYSVGAEVVLYTNGRQLKDLDFCSKLVEKVNRIVIPIHGEQKIHDSVTQQDGSFLETICGINNVHALDRKKLELKFILNYSRHCLVIASTPEKH